MERIADHAVHIAKRTRFLDGAIPPKMMKRLEAASAEALGAFGSASKALLEKDYRLAESTARSIEDMVMRLKELVSGLEESPNSLTVRLVLEDIRRAAEYSSDIVEVAIDENIGSVIRADPKA